MSRAPTRTAAAVVAVATALQAATPAVAHAHTGLRRAVPARDARLSAAPRELRLTFTEAVEPAVARVTLLAPDGTAVPLAPLERVADSVHVVTAAVRGALPAPGTYTVRWQVAGRDGHPVRGSYAFAVLPGAAGLGAPAAPPAARDTAAARRPAAPAPATPPAPEAGAFDAESPLYVAVRWAGYVALLVVVGAVAFRLLLTPALRRAGAGAAFVAAAERRAAALGLGAAAGLLAAAAARLVAKAAATLGGVGAGALATTVGGTLWGGAWALQAAGAVLAALGFAAARRGGARAGWGAAAGAAAALALSAALGGHAVAAQRLAPLAVAADALHVLGAAGWLGTLLVLVAAGLPAAREGRDGRGAAHAAALVHAFSPAALACAGLAALTGVFAAWLHLGRLGALWEGAYGRLLLAKLAALALVALAGAFNWRRVRPALGSDAGTARLRRVATAELAAGALVLLATAALVATPTPAESPEPAASASR